MKKELEEQLVSIAPYMFRYDGWNDESKSLMVYGFCCDNGWFGLLKELIEGIAKIDTNKEVKVGQVKEKFGTLRFYLDGGESKEVSKLIRIAEDKSAVTCEYCGAPGVIRKGGWLVTLCDKCNEERKK